MKSITLGIGYLMVVLVVDVSSTDLIFVDVPMTILNSPYNFGFYKEPDKLLFMEIILKNIPSSVAAVNAIRFIFDGSRSSKPQVDTTKVNVDKTTREAKFIILQSLRQHQFWVDVRLYNGGGLCSKTKITEWRVIYSLNGWAYYWDTTQYKTVYQEVNIWKPDDSGACFAPNACEIILDFKDTCKAQPKSNYGDNVECHIKESQYICTFVRAATNYQDLKWSQTYEDNSVIGPELEIKQQTTKFTIKLELELFDNNTSLKLMSTRLRTNKTLWSDTPSITVQDISKASNVTILNYTDTTEVQFNCEQYEHRSTKIYVGFINTTDNKITTRNTTILKRNKFKMADNGTILCCLFYESKSNTFQEITRFVENKTLLIYQPQESTSTNVTESNEQKKASCQEWWVYVLPTFLGTAILLLTIYFVKRRWCTNSQAAEETVELDNYATTNQVLYANLDLVHNESRAGNQTEESPYANIVGVLHPL